MKPKNTICVWFDKDAHQAARFYAATFPDSKVTAVHEAPSDYPGGEQGDVLTVEFTVLGIPCLGLNRRSDVQAQRGVFVPDREGQSRRDGPLVECDRWKWRRGKCVRLVQGPLGHLLADHSASANRRACGWWRPGKTCLRGDDADEENRHRHDRGSVARLTYTTGLQHLAVPYMRPEAPGAVLMLSPTNSSKAASGAPQT